MSAVHKEQMSLGELFSELSDETRVLVRQEIELAKTEMKQKASFAAKNAAMAAVGTVVMYVGILTLVAAMVIGLGHLIGYGLSALIIGLVIAGIGGGIAMTGVNALKKGNLAPVETQQQLEETKVWAKEQIRH
jgi:Ca2+/Na+ antiporter